jgi:DNA modification methylase
VTVRILIGDVRERLRELPDESVHCVVTSPPYFGLRDYGVAGQIGLERTPDDFIAAMVEVFREVRRVLRADGTLWLNLGDSYSGGKMGRDDEDEASLRRRFEAFGTGRPKAGRKGANGQQRPVPAGCKPKDLLMIPARVALALQADGWWLRSDIIWHKPNPMPESVTDRPTSAHEHVFLLAKSERYYFDQEAVLEPVSPNTHARLSQDVQNQIGSARAHAGGKTNGNMKAVGRKMAEPGSGVKNNSSMDAALAIMPSARNIRNVWTVATQPFSEAHFATFPPALIEPCIKAGCPEGGTVLDPFGGAGTTGLVADRLKRNAILIELNPEYAAMAERRIKCDAPMFTEVTAA